jgi:hypothetical protein
MLGNKIKTFFGSKLFFSIIVGFFSISSLWFAVSSTYPMAFDEEVHYGITKMYAENLNPFAIEQTPEANKYGAVETDASYVFYYLLSFPYRLLNAIHDSEVFIVTSLRVLNIVIFVWALFLYRRLFDGIGVSRPLSQLAIAIFTLIPIVPMLAAQINYDNLIMALIPLLFIAALAAHKGLQKGSLPIVPTVGVIALILYGCTVKYAFLPIATVVGVYCLVLLMMAMRTHQGFWKKTWVDIKAQRPLVLVGLVLLVLPGLLFFGQRYGRNLIQYQSPVPDCGVVLSVEECMEWGPWGRDYQLEHSKPADAEQRNLVHYTATHWAWGMWNRLFFTLAGPLDQYATRNRLPIPSGTFIVLVAVGTLASLAFARRLYRQYPAFLLFLLATLAYVGVLVMQQYGMYVQTGQPVAINGRYMLPLMPLLAVMLAGGMILALRRMNLLKAAPYIGMISLLLFLQGGGVLTYIMRSESSWLYDEPAIQQIDHTLKTVLRPVIYE